MRRYPRMVLAGVGYIGGSLALAARRAGLVERVVGVDPASRALAEAGARGVIDETAADIGAAAAGADLIVLAAPVGALAALVRAVGKLAGGALVIDVGSVKRDVVAAGDDAMPSGRFVGCHPLAGLEAEGVAAARADLFDGKPCLVCAGARSDAAAVAEAVALWRALGADTLPLDAERHDALMAAVSHLPHAAAFALAGALAQVAGEVARELGGAAATTSLRDTTRIAASSAGLWRDVFLANRAALLPLLDAVQAEVAGLAAAVRAGDGDALVAALERARATRHRLVPRS